MLRHDIYEALRRDILSCALAPGAELREQELAARFNVSKSPVRESLQLLVREGLVSVVPRQGYRVAPVSLSSAHDLFAFRQVLELACLSEAISRADDDTLAALDAFRTVDQAKYPDFISYNRAFHSCMAQCSGNQRMARTTCDVIDEMDRLVLLSVNAMRSRDPGRLVAEHVAIIDAVQARNAKLALKLLRAHTTSAERRLKAALEWTAVQA